MERVFSFLWFSIPHQMAYQYLELWREVDNVFHIFCLTRYSIIRCGTPRLPPIHGRKVYTPIISEE
ncbi:MAG: hypothetical protein QXF50_00170 [Sulfolobales archaeon]